MYMIIYYNKKTSEILGTIEGRVHYDHHLKSSISIDGVLDNDIGRVIIGHEDTGEIEKFINEKGEEGIKPIYKDHNLHLWKWQEKFEDPKQPRPHLYKVILDEEGNVIDFMRK